jgi:hypothetical protein
VGGGCQIHRGIASRPGERDGCEHDEGRHEQHDVCEERHFNNPAKRTRDLEQTRRDENIYTYITEFLEFYSFRKY